MLFNLVDNNQQGYYDMSEDTFFALPNTSRLLSLSEPDTLLLDAALFHATNEARNENGLPLLKYDASLYQAASSHALSMIVNKFYGHVNPYSVLGKTADNRVRIRTKQFARVAENIGQYQTIKSNEWIRVRWNKKAARYEYFYNEDGEVCPAYTYTEFARYAVKQWMESAHHRANLLSGNYTHVGCAARLISNPYQERRAPYATLVQNFGGPL